MLRAIRRASSRVSSLAALFGGAAVAWALTARAQQAMKMPRIGILSPGRSELSDPNFNVINGFVPPCTQGRAILAGKRQHFALCIYLGVMVISTTASGPK
jgi:hypothetical protein